MKTAYENSGFSVCKFNLKNLIECEFIALNFYENSIYTSKLLARALVLILLKLFGKKIIWTMHDKQQVVKKNRKNSMRFVKLQIALCDKIIIHSKISIDEIKAINSSEKILEKIIHIPHPNYIGVYGDIKHTNLPSDKLKLLHIGLIRPYKNVDLLIEAVSELNLPNLELFISGACDKNLQKCLLEKINGNAKITTDFRFIPDDEIAELISKHHLLALPYDSICSLNSGSAILAFSYAKSVICTLNGTLSDIEDKGLFWAYEYKNDEHKDVLKKQIKEVYDRFSGDFNELNAVGKKCFEYVAKHNSSQKISSVLKETF